MFTGIVTAIGHISETAKSGDLHVTIACPFDPETMAIGASICCSGVCLTVVERGGKAGEAWFAVDVSDETLRCTADNMWAKGASLNLEPALKLGDELGGHLVTGHVDAVGTVALARETGGSIQLDIRAPQEIAAFIAEKGSITVQGVSLTVNAVQDHEDGACTFSLNIIPHTGEVTTLGQLAAGDAVNLEIDVLARYLKRMQDLQQT